MRVHVMPTTSEVVPLEPEGEPDERHEDGNGQGDDQREAHPAPRNGRRHEIIPRDGIVVVGPHRVRVGAARADVDRLLTKPGPLQPACVPRVTPGIRNLGKVAEIKASSAVPR